MQCNDPSGGGEDNRTLERNEAVRRSRAEAVMVMASGRNLWDAQWSRFKVMSPGKPTPLSPGLLQPGRDTRHGALTWLYNSLGLMSLLFIPTRRS